MSSKLFLIILCFALAAVAVKSFDDGSWSHFNAAGREAACTGPDCIEEDDDAMELETSRRQLAGGRYISYGALRANNVPCNRRGQSYYNCGAGAQANPYTRGCSVITHCARSTA